MDVVVHTVDSYLKNKATESRSLWVAYSGGLDSHVLLHALHHLSKSYSVTIHAVHVNHQLQPEALQWVNHCQHQCELLGISCDVLTVDGKAGPRQSPEDAARKARYQALSEHLPKDAILLTAHHQRDQAETLLLQLMRGAGLAGLAAMPESKLIHGIQLDRPLLNCSHQKLKDYAVEQGLQWIEDPSNQDLSIRRNYVRQNVLPTLKSLWSESEVILAKSAGYLADSLKLQESLLDNLLKTIVITPDCIDLNKLNELPAIQQSHCLRHWYQSLGLPRPSDGLLDTIFNEVIHAKADAQPLFKFAGSQLIRTRKKLILLPEWQQIESEIIQINGTLTLARPEFNFSITIADNAAHEKTYVQLGDYSATIDLRGQPRALKKFYKEIGLPKTLRSVMPLIFVNDELVLIPGLYEHASLTDLTYHFEINRLTTVNSDLIREIFH